MELGSDLTAERLPFQREQRILSDIARCLDRQLTSCGVQHEAALRHEDILIVHFGDAK